MVCEPSFSDREMKSCGWSPATTSVLPPNRGKVDLILAENPSEGRNDRGHEPGGETPKPGIHRKDAGELKRIRLIKTDRSFSIASSGANPHKALSTPEG